MDARIEKWKSACAPTLLQQIESAIERRPSKTIPHQSYLRRPEIEEGAEGAGDGGLAGSLISMAQRGNA
jgi:hypothetical protein